MAGYFDKDTIAEIIEDGRQRQASSNQIADDVVQLLERSAWLMAAAHPTRLAILRHLGLNGPTSPVRFVEQVDGVSMSRASYHFRTLRDQGLIEICDEVPRRGSVEHIYRLAE